MLIRDVFLSVLVALLWGFNYVATKVSTMAFDPMTAMFLRYLCVIVPLSPILIKIPRHFYGPIAKVSLIFGVGYFGLFFYAAHELSASLTAIILQLQIPFSMLLSALLLQETIPLIAWSGMALAFMGVFLAVGKISWQGNLFPVLLLSLAALSWGYFNVLIRRLKLKIDPLSLNAGIAAFSLPFFLMLVWLMEPMPLSRISHANFNAWLCVLYMGLVATIFCYSKWFVLIQRYGIALITPFAMLTPIFGVITGHYFLGDPLMPHLVFGIILTIAGIGLIVLPSSLRAWRERKIKLSQVSAADQ